MGQLLSLVIASLLVLNSKPLRRTRFVLFAMAAFLLCETSSGQDLIVPFNSITNYDDNFQVPPSQGALAWEDLNYNDNAWDSGFAELGYGDGDEATVVNTVRTAYFRNEFTLPNLCNYSSIELTLIIDDGAVVYVNGVEVDRFNMPTGPVNYNTFANRTVTDNEQRSTTVSTTLFNPGLNVVAVEMHQRNVNSSDLSYNVQVEGTLSVTPCTCINGAILDVDNDGICDDVDNCIGSNCELDLNQFSLCSRTNINQIADDLSGVAYNDVLQRLVVVENGTPRAYETDLSGTVIRTLFLNGFEDTEGITYAGNNQYFITEERARNIVLVTIPPGNSNITINHPGNSSLIHLTNEGNRIANDGLEGVTYDRANDILYAVKELADLEVYEINNAMARLGTNYFAPEAFDVSALSSSYPGGYTDLAGISFTSFGTLLLLSEEGDYIVEVDAETGSLISNLNLAPSLTPQPEGVTVISDSEIIVVGEANEFLTYRAIGGTCNDNNVCTTNDTFDSSCNCVGTNMDSDNDGICDGLDVCPNLDDSLVGSSCSDGNPCTINDVWQSNCSCAGIILDTDNDGICDGLDSCPMLDNSLIGQPCSDGNPNTVGDVFTSNCMCIGTGVVDSDGDGVPDSMDQCPNLDDNLIGVPCSDGNVCTTGDVYTANCNCVGTPSTDSDNDGICDAIDSCPNLDNNLIGQPCNDGNANTSGDTWQTNCTCVGTGIVDSDGDGVHDSIDQCPNFDNNLIGQNCNDGNFCTEGDVYTFNCLCAGTTSPDSDGDGLCDPIDTCPNLRNSLIGSSCDDGKVCTVNDIYLTNCNCVGTPLVDSDNDGICDDDDMCPNFNDGFIGLPCNDGQSCTTNDVFTINCVCAGTPINDSNSNGICDEDEIICQSIIMNSDNISLNTSLSAIILIESNNIIPSSSIVEFTAGQRIELTSGFEVLPGAIFEARIEACQ